MGAPGIDVVSGFQPKCMSGLMLKPDFSSGMASPASKNKGEGGSSNSCVVLISSVSELFDSTSLLEELLDSSWVKLSLEFSGFVELNVFCSGICSKGSIVAEPGSECYPNVMSALELKWLWVGLKEYSVMG
jgi:hypothetical protein